MYNELDTVEAEYRLSLFNKIFYSLLAAGMLFFVAYMSGRHWKHPADAWFVLPPMIAFAILLLVNLRRKVTISSNSIKNVGPFTTKELPLTAVKGMRLPSKGIVLEPLSSEYPTIEIGNYFDLTNSDNLLQWARNNFPDLDATDLEKAQQQLLQDDTSGDTAPRKQQMLDRARTIVPVYNTAASILAFFCIILFNGKFSSVLLLLLPLAGIFLLFTHNGFIKFFSVSNRSINPAVFWGIFLSSFSLLIHTVFYYDLLLWYGLLLPASIITAITGWLIYKKGINPTAGELKGQIFFIAAVSMAYGVGSTRLLNCAFDHSKENAYPAVLQDRFISSGRSSKSYYFVLSPWGPKLSSAKVEVGRLLYRVQKVGDTVTVQLKQGLLDAPWYWVEKREDNLIIEKEKN